MEIVFVRHAQPAWIADGVGVANPGLTSLGTLQAQQTAAALSEEESFDEMLVSPMVRTAQTAEPIIEALDLDPLVVPGLEEITATDWSGTPAEEVAHIFQEQRRRPLDDWWDGFPGGESFRQFHQRINATMLEILAERDVVPCGQPQLWDLRADPGRLLIVAHGGTDAVALGFLLGLEPVPWEWERFASPHASISRIRAIPLADAHIFALASFAEVRHLSDVTY